ncbi:MAG: YtxH domain-containing protein [Chloroflexia bacterium]
MHPFWKGFLAGLLVGAAVALLLSPGKGEENRALLRQRFQEAREAARQAAQKQEEALRARYLHAIGAREQEG